MKPDGLIRVCPRFLMMDTRHLCSLAAAALFCTPSLPGYGALRQILLTGAPKGAPHILVSMLISAKYLAPRAGFEPATNRLTVVFSRYCLQYAASTCIAQTLINRQYPIEKPFRLIAGYCA